MNSSELTRRNFRKICVINGILFLPLLFLLSWPYYYAGSLFNLAGLLQQSGAILFGLPFTFTILHGIVTVSVGSVQRTYFYKWLRTRPYSYGLLFHPILVSTRFRLALILASLLLFVTGLILNTI